MPTRPTRSNPDDPKDPKAAKGTASPASTDDDEIAPGRRTAARFLFLWFGLPLALIIGYQIFVMHHH